MVWLYLRENNFLAVTRNHRVLHVAPEESLRNELKRVYCSGYYGCDAKPERPGVEWVFSVEDIPFKEEFFDIVICNHVLEHVADDQRAMNEFGRVLKPGGIALVTIPIERGRENTFEDFGITSPEERAVYFGQGDHLRRYGTDAMKRLAGDKFSVKRFLGRDFPTSEAYGLRMEEPLFVFSRLPANASSWGHVEGLRQ